MFSFCSYTRARHRGLGAARLLAPAVVAAAVVAGSGAAGAGDRLAGPFPARVERVIDGDSLAVRVEVWLGLEVATIVRLRGIDAPELTGRCPDERRRAAAARDALAALVGEGLVTLAMVETDKYGGRVVADVAVRGGRPLATALVEAGLASPYGGGRRAGWCG